MLFNNLTLSTFAAENKWLLINGKKKRQSKIAEKEESGGIFGFCNQAYICSCGLSGYLFYRPVICV